MMEKFDHISVVDHILARLALQLASHKNLETVAVVVRVVLEGNHIGADQIPGEWGNDK
jgi:hypothetical protein